MKNGGFQFEFYTHFYLHKPNVLHTTLYDTAYTHAYVQYT